MFRPFSQVRKEGHTPNNEIIPVSLFEISLDVLPAASPLQEVDLPDATAGMAIIIAGQDHAVRYG